MCTAITENGNHAETFTSTFIPQTQQEDSVQDWANLKKRNIKLKRFGN